MHRTLKKVFPRMLLTAACLLVFAAGFGTAARASEEGSTAPALSEAISLGLVGEDIATRADETLTAEVTVKLMRGALAYLGKDSEKLEEFETAHSDQEQILRYQLARLLYDVHRELIGGRKPYFSGAGIYYEENKYSELYVVHLADLDKINEVTGNKPEACDYAIRAFDMVTGDKLMNFYDDWTFRPENKVSIGEAVQTFLHYARSFEEDPIYVDVTDDRAAKHTLDPALYEGDTGLPDFTAADLPDWRGFNIGMHSMLVPGALCGNPDDDFHEALIPYVKSLGANFVHCYLSWSWFQGPDYTCDNRVNLSRLAQLDQMLAVCIENGVHLQIVFNDVPNIDGEMSLDHWASSLDKIFTDEKVQDNVTIFWRMLARRYADIPSGCLSFNLMNECSPQDDDAYLQIFGDSVHAIQEESPQRVIVADVHSGNITGETMAEIGCALSFHLYQPRDLAVVSRSVEMNNPGYYESAAWPMHYFTGVMFGPEAEQFPELAGQPARISGNIGGARLTLKLLDVSGPGQILRIAADGVTLYEQTPEDVYHEERDWYEVPDPIILDIPEEAQELSFCLEKGFAFSIDSMSLSWPDGREVRFDIWFDGWNGTPYADLQIDEDLNVSGGRGLDLAGIPVGLVSLRDLVEVGRRCGVDVMVGEFGMFTESPSLDFVVPQKTAAALLRDEMEMFQEMGLSYSWDLMGQYNILSPAPCLLGVSYEKIDRIPYYANQTMEQLFRDMMKD